LKGASQEVTPRELEMAKHLIGAMTTDWNPQKYENSYQLALKQLVEEKLHNRPPAPEALPTPKQMGMDIVAILQQSLAQATEKKKKPAQGAGRRSTSQLVKQKRPRNGSRLKSQNN
jgi:DNA end-binding protein Ku